MKRKIIIFTVFLVNIALLANILIPHHHHQDEVCFISMDCDADCSGHDHGDADHKQDACKNHDTEGAEDHQNCLMDIEVIVPSNHGLSQKIAMVFLEDQFGFDGNATLGVILETHNYLPSGLLEFSPLIIQQNSCILSHSLGLRAPPC